MLNFENLDHACYVGTGKYDIPVILPEDISYEQVSASEIIPFNHALSTKNRSGKAVHFFIHDYQFNRVWNSPDKYIDILSDFDFVISPDFSIYSDMPEALRIYSHYKKHWCSAYWQEHGIKVIPNISWSDEKSFEWCFDGEPTGGIVAVSNMGCSEKTKWHKAFMRGYEKMIKRLQPSWIIFYGQVPVECDWNVIRVNPYYDKIVKRRKRGNKFV